MVRRSPRIKKVSKRTEKEMIIIYSEIKDFPSPLNFDRVETTLECKTIELHGGLIRVDGIALQHSAKNANFGWIEISDVKMIKENK